MNQELAVRLLAASGESRAIHHNVSATLRALFYSVFFEAQRDQNTLLRILYFLSDIRLPASGLLSSCLSGFRTCIPHHHAQILSLYALNSRQYAARSQQNLHKSLTNGVQKNRNSLLNTEHREYHFRQFRLIWQNWHIRSLRLDQATGICNFTL